MQIEEARSNQTHHRTVAVTHLSSSHGPCCPCQLPCGAGAFEMVVQTSNHRQVCVFVWNPECFIVLHSPTHSLRQCPNYSSLSFWLSANCSCHRHSAQVLAAPLAVGRAGTTRANMDIELRDSDRLDDAIRIEAARQEVAGTCLTRALRVAGVDLAGPSVMSCIGTAVACMSALGFILLSTAAFSGSGENRPTASVALEIILWNFIWVACYTLFFTYKWAVQAMAMREFAATLARYHRSELFAEPAASSSSSSLDSDVRPLSDGHYTVAASAMVPRPGHETVRERKSDNISAYEACCICCFEHARGTVPKPANGKIRVHKWKGNRWRRVSVVVPDSAQASEALLRGRAAAAAAAAAAESEDMFLPGAGGDDRGGTPVKGGGRSREHLFKPIGTDSRHPANGQLPLFSEGGRVPHSQPDSSEPRIQPDDRRPRFRSSLHTPAKPTAAGPALHTTTSGGTSDLTFEAEAADALLDNLTLQALRPFPEELEQLRAALEALPPSSRPSGALRVHRARLMQAALVLALFMLTLLGVSTASLVSASQAGTAQLAPIVRAVTLPGFAVLYTASFVFAVFAPMAAIVSVGAIMAILAAEPHRIRATLRALSTIRPVHHRSTYDANLQSLLRFHAQQRAVADGTGPEAGQQSQQQAAMMQMLRRAPSGISTQAFLDDALTPFDGRLVSRPVGAGSEPSDEASVHAMMLAAGAGAVAAAAVASLGTVRGPHPQRRASLGRGDDGGLAMHEPRGEVARAPSAPASPAARRPPEARTDSTLREAGSGRSGAGGGGPRAESGGPAETAVALAMQQAGPGSESAASSSIGERRRGVPVPGGAEDVRGAVAQGTGVAAARLGVGSIERRRQRSAGDAEDRLGVAGLRAHARAGLASAAGAADGPAAAGGAAAAGAVEFGARLGQERRDPEQSRRHRLVKGASGAASANAGLTYAAAARSGGTNAGGGMLVVARGGAEMHRPGDLEFGVSRDHPAGALPNSGPGATAQPRTMQAALRRRGATLRPWLRVFDAQLARVRAQRRTARRVTQAFGLASGITTVLMIISGLGFVTLSTSASSASSGGPAIPLVYAGLFFALSQMPLLKSAYYTHSLRQPMLVITASPAGVLAQCAAIRAAEVSVMLAARAEADAVSICGAVIDPASAIRLASLEISLVVLALQQINSGRGLFG